MFKINCDTARMLNVKGSGDTLNIARLRGRTTLQKRSGMALVVEGFHSLSCISARLSTPVFAFFYRSWSSFTDPRGTGS